MWKAPHCLHDDSHVLFTENYITEDLWYVCPFHKKIQKELHTGNLMVYGQK